MTACVSHHQWNAGIVRDLCNCLDVGHIVPWVAYALNEHGLCLVINRFLEVLWIVSVHELARDTKSRKKNLELIVGATVKV